jgi:hypothetical protein
VGISELHLQLGFPGAATTRFHPCGLKPTPDQIASLRLQRHKTLPEWNYTIKPQL